MSVSPGILYSQIRTLPLLVVTSVAHPYGVALLAVGVALLGYTYLLYPWLARRLPERAPASPGTRASRRRSSVIIAARQPGVSIAGKAKSVLDEPSDCVQEIIVVLDGPDSIARQALSALNDDRVVVVQFPERRGKAAALNDAVRRARCDTLVMADARQRISVGSIERLLEVLDSPDVGAVSGALEINRAEGKATLLDWYWRHERALRDAEARWDSAVGVSGALYAVKRTHWRELPTGLLLDDLAVAMNVVRSGARVAFARDAAVEDVPVGSDRTEFARKVRTLTGNFQYIAWNPWVLLPWRNRIWWQFVSHKALRLLTPFAGLLVVMGVAIVASSVLLPGIVAAGALCVAAAVLSRLGVRVAIAIAAAVRSAMMLNGALVVATANAFRGRWDVWQDPARPAFRSDG